MPNPKTDSKEDLERAIDDARTLRRSLTRQIWTADEMIQGCQAAANKVALDKVNPTWRELAPHVKEQIEQMVNQWHHRADELRRSKDQMLQQLGRINSYTLPRLKEKLGELETGSLFK